MGLVKIGFGVLDGDAIRICDHEFTFQIDPRPA
jgi:hypothetical protein